MMIFLSYAESDRSEAEILYKQLTEHGNKVFFASARIIPGQSILREISDALDASDIFVLLWSAAAFNSPWVTQELYAALHKSTYAGKPVIYPVRLDDTPIPILANHLRISDIAKGYTLDDVADAITAHYSDSGFSDSIKQTCRMFDREVSQLTREQYRIIEFLRHQKRFAIKGCAGSGKTLVAAEMAIRYARGGLQTLLLCHNPVLAEYLRLLTRGSGVHVLAITSWIKSLARGITAIDLEWSHHSEPAPEEVELAASLLVSRKIFYDAIIVDEGQDFREDWWILVELSLAREARIHAFFDENQTLLSFRSECPISDRPYVLSRNVRNGGAIFNLMGSFQTLIPEPEVGLKHFGEILVHPVNRVEKMVRKLKWVVAKRLKLVHWRKLVVLIPDSNKIEAFISNLNKVDGPSIARNLSFRPFWQKPNFGVVVHGIDSFKGMESDLVVLFIGRDDAITETYLYVAIARSRLFLDIVADARMCERIQRRSAYVKKAEIEFARRK